MAHSQTHSEGGGADYDVSVRILPAGTARPGSEAMHSQTHSESGGGGSLESVRTVQQVLKEAIASRLAGAGAAAAHSQTHSEGGGGSLEVSIRERMAGRLSGLAAPGQDAMHSQTHSETGGSLDQGLRNQLTIALNRAVHEAVLRGR